MAALDMAQASLSTASLSHLLPVHSANFNDDLFADAVRSHGRVDMDRREYLIFSVYFRVIPWQIIFTNKSR